MNKELYNVRNSEEMNMHTLMGIGSEIELFLVKDEIDLILMFCLLVFLLDPDFLGGYDIE